MEARPLVWRKVEERVEGKQGASTHKKLEGIGTGAETRLAEAEEGYR